MKSDKIIIVIALVIVLSAFMFKRQIQQVFFYGQSEVIELEQLIEEFPQLYLYPLSQQERKKAVTDHIEKVSTLQQQLSKNSLTPSFINFTAFENHLANCKQYLQTNEIEDTFGAEAISFTTVDGNLVIAFSQFPEEQLLKFGSVIDKAFSQEKSNDAVFTIDLAEDGHLFVRIICLFDIHSIEKQRYQKFANQVSKEAFCTPITLSIFKFETEDELIFTSPPPKLPFLK